MGNLIPNTIHDLRTWNCDIWIWHLSNWGISLLRTGSGIAGEELHAKVKSCSVGVTLRKIEKSWRDESIKVSQFLRPLRIIVKDEIQAK
jgi:hypothetical protein